MDPHAASDCGALCMDVLLPAVDPFKFNELEGIKVAAGNSNEVPCATPPLIEVAGTTFGPKGVDTDVWYLALFGLNVPCPCANTEPGGVV